MDRPQLPALTATDAGLSRVKTLADDLPEPPCRTTISRWINHGRSTADGSKLKLPVMFLNNTHWCTSAVFNAFLAATSTTTDGASFRPPKTDRELAERGLLATTT